MHILFLYRQPRVQVSPRIMMVAVAVPVSPPDQHSPRLGHLASSQTVWSLSSRSFFLIWTYFSPPGTASFIHLGLGRGFFLVPTSTEYANSDRVGDSRASRARRPSRVLGNSEGGGVAVVEVEEEEKVLVMVLRALHLHCIVSVCVCKVSLSLCVCLYVRESEREIWRLGLVFWLVVVVERWLLSLHFLFLFQPFFFSWWEFFFFFFFFF